MMKLRLTVLAVACLFSTSALAEDDAMEVQRCVWRCQSNYGSNWNRYEQCVAELCSGESQAKQSKPRVQKKHQAKKKKSTKRRVIRNRNGDVLIRRF